MKKLIIVLLSIITLASCTERMTKQFILETEAETKPQSFKIENWDINPPKLIAYKNKAVDEILNIPYLYWLTIQANSLYRDTTNYNLTIDSVGLEFIDLDTTLWRVPSRVVPHKETKNQKHIAFDFFKDNGIMISDSVNKIRLFFDAVFIDTITNSKISHPVSFIMIRQDSIAATPFMLHQ